MESHYFVAPKRYRHPTRIVRVKPTTRCIKCRTMRKNHHKVSAEIAARDCERFGRW